MKNLKRNTALLPISVISADTSYFVTRQIKREEKEHKLILAQLELNEDIMKVEDPKKTGIKFIRHPESKELSANKKIKWCVRIDGLMKVQLDNNQSIDPSDKNLQFCYYFHEKGHLENKNKGHFVMEKTCGYSIKSCLRKELEAEMNVIKNSKKIGKKFEKAFWPTRLLEMQEHCKECVKLINQGKCSKKEHTKIKKYLNIIARSVKND